LEDSGGSSALLHPVRVKRQTRGGLRGSIHTGNGFDVKYCCHFNAQDTLVDGLQVDLFSIRVIGFSLGAQTAGNIGNAFNGALPRVTGLDPAGMSSRERWRMKGRKAVFI